MSEDITRRRALELVSAATVAGAGTGVASAGGTPSSESANPHALANDLEVKDFGKEPGEIAVRFLRDGDHLEFEESFDFGGLGGSQTPKQSVESVDVEGDAAYVLQVRTPAGVTTERMEIPRGGVQPESTILVTRYPDDSVRISLVLR